MAKNKSQKIITPVPAKGPETPAAAKANKAIAPKWYIIILVAIAFIVNVRTIGYDYALDDMVYTSENTLIGIKDLGAIPALLTHGKNYNFDKTDVGSYRPLLPVSFAVEHHFFGFNPAVSHAINLVLFCLLVMVLFKLLQRMFSGYSIYIPFLITLLFALHPIHTEVVANVKSRDELLSMLFTVLSMLQSFRYIDNNKVKHLILSAVYFFIALLSKESAICFVAIVPLTLYFFTNGKPVKFLVAGIPYLLMAVVFMVMRSCFLTKPSGNETVLITENFLVGASGFAQKFATICWIQLRYIVLLIFPHPLSYDYSYNQVPVIGFADPKAILALLILAGLLVYAAMGFRRKDVFSFCILFYFLAASITSNLFVEIGATMGERFLFVPSLGFCIALVFIIIKLFKTDASSVTYATTPKLSVAILAIAVLYSAKTMARNEDWKNNFELFKSGLETTPGSWRTHDYLGMEYEKLAVAEHDPNNIQHYANEAAALFRQSIEIYPLRADTHADLGAMYLLLKNYDSALVHLKQAVALNPKQSTAMANIGMVYMRMEKFPPAIEYFVRTISIDSMNILAEFNGAYCYTQVTKYDSAILHFKRSIAIDPEYSEHKAFDNTAILYKMTGKMDSALKYEALARQRNPAFKL